VSGSNLEFGPVLRRIGNGYRRDWPMLLLVGLLVFVPLGLLTALDPFAGYETDDWDGLSSVLQIGLAIAQSIVVLLGTVFYSGVVAAGEQERHSGERHSFGHVARTLPYGTLILADLALIIVLAFGFLFLIVPGFILMTWLALIAPIIEMEKLNVRSSFRRSRAMVKPYFWRVAGVIIPVTVLQSLLEGAGDQLGHSLLGETFFGNWLGSIVANLLGAPLYALAVLALYFEIVIRERPGS